MERFFILDKFNTWYDWKLVLTAKSVTPPTPKTNYVKLDGMSGTLDLSESLTNEVTYEDRTVTATFWTDYGNRKDREKLLNDITRAIHGKKIRLIEPDDTEHYFYGRVKIKSTLNNLAYAEFTIEATCEPWRYALTDSVRRVDVSSDDMTNIVINNNGVKTLSPSIDVTGLVTVKYEDITKTLREGTYKLPDIKLRQGVNVIGVSGNGSATFTYKEGDL